MKDFKATFTLCHLIWKSEANWPKQFGRKQYVYSRPHYRGCLPGFLSNFIIIFISSENILHISFDLLFFNFEIVFHVHKCVHDVPFYYDTPENDNFTVSLYRYISKRLLLEYSLISYLNTFARHDKWINMKILNSIIVDDAKSHV